MKKWTLPVAIAALLAAACNKTEPLTPVESRSVTAASVAAPVTVAFDADGIPHVTASSDADAAYAVGWVQARDRLFQMDFLRKAARGRLAEMLGAAALPNDVSIRTFFTAQAPVASGARAGSYRVEDAIAATMPAEFRAILEAYAAGVNRYVADMYAGLAGTVIPAEYAALQGAFGTAYTIAPWTVEDSIAIGRLQSWLLSGSVSEEIGTGQVYQGVLAACGGTTSGCLYAGLVADLTRFAPAAQAFILPGAGVNPTTLSAGAPARVPGLDAALGQARELLSRTRGLQGPELAGSNNWVLSPSRASGYALVANDPHLALLNPPIFHLVHITTPTRNVGGVAFAGGPAIPIGHNDSIAWGDTVVGYDVTDVYYFPEGPDGAPVLPPGTTPVVISESYSIRGETTAETRPVTLIPGYGPIIAHTGGLYLTARWTGQEPSNETEAFWDLNAAGSVDQAFTALEKFQVGAQNFVIGDVAGAIGYYPHAYVPVRKAGCWSPTKSVVPWAPMPGYDGSCAWVGRIPDADLPKTKNPPNGFVVTANNDVTGVTAGNNPLSRQYYLYPTTDLGYRAARIEGLVTAKASGHTFEDMTTYQADNRSLFAADLVPALLAWFDGRATEIATKHLDAAVAVLRHWADPANPQQYRTPTGLASADPAGAASSDAEIRAAASASMLFHALVPRLAGTIVDPALEPVEVAGDSLTALRIARLVDSQLVAKYLSALALTVRGSPPPVPLNVPPAAVCGGDCAARAVSALEETVAMLSDPLAFGSSDPATWLWGRKHRLYLRANITSATTLFDFGPVANDGGLYTVDVANISWNDAGPDGFVQSAGANVRIATELRPGAVRWRAVLPGGQSGHVGDPTYQGQLPSYLSNAPGDLPWSAAEVAAATRARLEFKP